MGASKLRTGLTCIQGRSISEMPTLNIAVLPKPWLVSTKCLLRI